MSIARRLSEEAVEHVDDQARPGLARSRANLVARAIARQIRHAAAERDVEKILLERRNDTSTELDHVAVFAAKTPLALD